MGHAVLSLPFSQVALARLDHLIAEVSHFQGSQTGLLLEHLQSARTYLLGAMPNEYEFSLETAKSLGKEFADTTLQRIVIQETGVLLDQMAAAGPPPQAPPSFPPMLKRMLKRPELPTRASSIASSTAPRQPWGFSIRLTTSSRPFHHCKTPRMRLRICRRLATENWWLHRPPTHLGSWRRFEPMSDCGEL